jgi:hypothetical protein
MSSDAMRHALAPFVGEWRILAAFGDTPAAGRSATTARRWEHDFDLTYLRS